MTSRILFSKDVFFVRPRGRNLIREALLTNFDGSFGSRVLPFGGPRFLGKEVSETVFLIIVDPERFLTVILHDGQTVFRRVKLLGNSILPMLKSCQQKELKRSTAICVQISTCVWVRVPELRSLCKGETSSASATVGD